MTDKQITPFPLKIDGNCFGCGPDNAAGLKMQFFTDQDRVFSSLSIPSHLCGWSKLAHGGIIATILDEIMGWTAIYFLRKLVLTRQMEVQFLKQVFTGQLVRAEGRVLEQSNPRNAVIRAVLINDQEQEAATAKASFALFTIPEAKKLGFLDEQLLNRTAMQFLQPEASPK